MAEAYHVSIFKIKFIETYNLHLYQLKPYTISGQQIFLYFVLVENAAFSGEKN